MKVCSKCKIEKPFSEFYKDKNGKDGYCNPCKACRAKPRKCLHCHAMKPKAVFHSNLAKLCLECEATLKYCPTCETAKPHVEFHSNPAQRDGLSPHCSDCKNEYRRKVNATPKGKRRRKRQYERYYGTKAYHKAIKKYRTGPRRGLFTRVGNANSKARKFGCKGSLTIQDIEALFERYDYCLNCGTTKKLTVDHVVPLAKGGDNTPDNLQVLCSSCNKSKNDKTIDYRLTDSLSPIAA